MAFDEIERGARQLIRAVLQERGIKHSSSDTTIGTVCFAHQPNACIKYVGRIRFQYGNDGTVTALVSKPYSSSRMRLIQISVISRDKRAFQMIYYGFNYDQINGCDFTKFDISNPDFDRSLGAFVDKYILEKHKKAVDHKLLLESEERFVPDIDDLIVIVPYLNKVQKWFAKCKRIYDRLLGKMPEIDDFYWEQAVRRHGRMTKEECATIGRTVAGLRLSGSTKNAIETMTDIIVAR